MIEWASSSGARHGEMVGETARTVCASARNMRRMEG